MACALTQGCIHTGNEGIQDLKGNKGLDGAGEAAAVYTESTLALEIMLAQSQRHSHILVGFVAGGNDVLQIHPGGMAAFLHQAQEGIEVTAAQSGNLLGNPLVVRVEVDGPQHSPVTAGLADLRDGGEEVSLVDLAQHVLAEVGTDLLQLGGDGSVLVGQICVVSAGVNDAQGMTAGAEVKVHRLNDGMLLIEEVDGDILPTAEAV